MKFYDSVEELDDKTRSELEGQLGSSEEFIAAAQATGGALARHHPRVIVTSDNLVRVKPAFFSADVQTIPLSGVSTVRTEKGSMFTTIHLHGSGGLEEEYQLKNSEADRIATVLREQVEKQEAVQ